MKRRRLLLETLEERILCSVTAPLDEAATLVQGAAEPAVAAASAETAATTPRSASEAATGRELIAVNANLPEAEVLIAELTSNLPGRRFEILRLDSYRDGIDQITQALGVGGESFDAVHLLGHSEAGVVTLGATRLNVANLESYAAQFARWDAALGTGAEILFYGCDLAATAAGQNLVQRLAVLSGAEVAASTDATGSAALGGDWQLEYASGPVARALGTDVNGPPAWAFVLGGTPIDGGTGAFAGVVGTGIYSISFDTGKATLLGTSDYVAAGGTLNSLGIDSINGIVYYADSASGSRAIYGFDLKTGAQFIVTSDVTSFGITLPAAGLGAAGGDFAGGAYYFSSEGGGPSGQDQIFRMTFASGSNGRTASSITLVDYLPGGNEFGDFIIVSGGTTKLFGFNSGVGVDEYNLTFTRQSLTAVQRDPNSSVRQAAADRNGTLYAVGSSIVSYNPAGTGTFGTARTITTNGSTALTDASGLADASAFVPAESSIGDRVWYDADLDGAADAGEAGISGLTVTLHDDLNGNGVLDAGERQLASTTTGANGAYTFGQLLPGDYLVRVTDPGNITQGAGSTTGGATRSVRITLVGQAVTNVDFGFEQPATLSVSSPSVTEGVAPHAVFTVSLSNPLQNAVTVNLGLTAGTATGGGTDFGASLEISTDGGATWTPTTSATIAAGSTSLLVRTPVTNDLLDEANETFTLTATRVSGRTTNVSAPGTATIIDNDPTPTLTITDLNVNEATGSAVFTVTLSAASGLPVSVAYATANNTAVAGADYSARSGTLTFSPGSTTQTISVPVTNDAIYEGAESFFVDLSSAVNAVLAGTRGAATINDDGTGTGGSNNDTPTLSVSAATVDPSFATFTVSLSNASAIPTVLGLTLADGTAIGGGNDYGASGPSNLQVSNDGGATWVSLTSATIAAGATSVLVRTPIVDDTRDELDETFTLTATRVSGATVNASATGLATIIDNDPTPTLVINDITVNEGAGTATFTVSLSAASGLVVGVNYATANGTALAGSDYTTTTGALTFAPETTTQTITVPLLNDSLFETSEQFSVSLSSATNAIIADGTGFATIRDDGSGSGGTDNDTPVISVSSPTVTEGTAFVVFTVSLSNPSSQTISGNLVLSNGSASGGGVDFGPGLQVSADGGLTWATTTTGTLPAGVTSVLVRTPLANDILPETAETFTLTATRTAGVTSNASATGTATIIDNDTPPTLSIDDVTVNEGASTATFTVTLSAPSSLPVSVGFATSSGTATSGGDFTATNGTVSFPAGTTSRTITVPLLNDSIFETSEAFSVTLALPVNATIADGTGIGTIRDDGAGSGGTDNDTPTLSVSGPLVTEGTDGFAVFTVSLSNVTTTATGLSLALAGVTAAGAGVDFGTAGAGNLQVSTDGGISWADASTAIIAAGTPSIQVRTPVQNDPLDEAAETLILTATRTSGVTTNASASGTATIVDNDPAPALSLADVSINEEAGVATFTVTLTAPSGLPVSVDYATSGNTATSGADFVATSGTLTFAPGVVSQTFTVSITDDAVFEASEAFTVTLSNAANATLADATASGSILDDGTGTGGTDNDTPALLVSSPTVTEGSVANAVFTVSLSNVATTPVVINLALNAGSATGSGVDFGGGLEVSTDNGATWVPGSTVSIAAGTTDVLVRTPLLDDLLDEAGESFTLTATRVAGSTVNSSATGTATIVDDDAPPALSIADVSVNEAAGTATFVVTLDAPSGLPVSVNFATASGSATSGSDFLGATGSLTFAPGVVSQTITVTLANDALYEVAETFAVSLSAPVNATLADGTGIGTIRDDGTGTGGGDNDLPSLAVSSPVATEGATGFVQFSVGLSNASTSAVGVSLALTTGTAGGSDFGPGLEVSTDSGLSWIAANSATIAPGITSILVRTPLVDDGSFEPAESFTLTATRTSGSTANASATGAASIVDNDSLPTLSINDLAVNEGAGTASFTVTLSAASALPVTVTYTASSGTATLGTDFAGSTGSLTFAPGTTTQTVTVALFNDSLFELSETFNIVLSSASNATIADSLGVGTIRDDGTGEGATDNDLPALTVSNIVATESVNTHATFSVALSNPAAVAVVTSFALSAGSATAGGVDFGDSLEVSTDGGSTWNPASTATIAAGTTSVLVRTLLADDLLSEAAETFSLIATRLSGPTSNPSATGIATIDDNEALPGLSIDDVTVNEAAGTATFTVTLATVSAQTVTVSYATTSGTATAGADFTAVNGTLSFGPGVLSQTITVPIGNDPVFEGSETFSVTLAAAINGQITDGTGVGSIRDDGVAGPDNDTPTLSISDPTVTEGTDAHVVFTLSLSNAATTPVEVSFALANGTASGGGADFGPGLEVSTDGGITWTAAVSATFAPSATTVLVRTPLVNDAISESVERFTLSATRTSGVTSNAAVTATASIADNDAPGSLSVSDVTVNEAAGSMTFTVTLSTPSSSTVTVSYATLEQTALAGLDFSATSGSLSFAPGITTQTFVVPVLNDAAFETSEFFNVVLSGATNATIAGSGTAAGTILDDGTGAGGVDNDRPTLSVGGVTVTEGANAFAVFNVALSNAATRAITVALALTNGTASGAGLDFGAGLEVSTNGGGTWTGASSATFAPGSTSILVRTAISDDALDEAAETFTLTADHLDGLTSNASATGMATIGDNDAPPSFRIDDVVFNEAAGAATFTVSLSTASGQAVAVDFASSSGSATAGSDFTNVTGTLSFAPGMLTRTISIPIANDTPYEGSESFTVVLSNPLNATIADSSGLGTILDDGAGLGGTNDDRPVNGLPLSFSGTEDGAISLSGISVSGQDLAAVVTVNFSISNGTLALSTSVSGGVTAGQVSGNGTGAISITARLDAINATLASVSGLTFTPVADFSGATQLTMATINGLGSDLDTAEVAVAAVADIASDSAFTNEDTAVTISVLANDSFENGGRAITAVDGQAVTPGGPAVTVAAGSVSLNGAGQLIFTPTANYNGATSFTYTVTSGGVPETAAVSVTVASVNDTLAVSTPLGVSSAEDGSVVFASANGNALIVEDVDGGQLEVTLSVPSGSLTLGSTSGVTFTTGDGVADQTIVMQGTAAALTAAMEGLVFVPNSDFSGTVPLSFNTRDIGAPVASLINGGFEQPGITGAPQLDEGLVDGWDTSATDNLIEIWRSGFNGGQPGPGVPAYEGSQFAEINATQSATLSQVINVPAGATLTYSFAHRGRAGVDVMNVRIVDLGTNGTLGGGDDTVLLNENFSDGNSAWRAYTRSVGTATGNLLLLEFTSVSTATGDQSIGNFVDGVALIAEQNIPKTIAIAVTPVADIASDTAVTPENTAVTIPVLSNDSFESSTAAVTAVNGQTVTPGGPAVSVSNGTVSVDSSNRLIFTPASNYNGTTNFTYTVTSGGVTETADVAVTVTPTNDAPTLDLDTATGGTSYATTFVENGGAVAVVGPGVTISDVDDSVIEGARVVLTNAQNGDSLTIFGSLPTGISATIDSSIPGQITVQFTGSAASAVYQSALQQIQFGNSSDNPATTARTLAITISDGSVDSSVATSTISLVAINDAPGITLPNAAVAIPSTPLVISGISFSDADAAGGTVVVTLSVTGGSLTLASGVPGGVSAGQISGNGSGTITVNASLAALNTTLAAAGGLTFLTDTSGTYTLTALISDAGNSGVDPASRGLPATGTASDEQASSQLTITTPPPTLAITNTTVTEGAAPDAIFIITLSNPAAGNVVLSLGANAGTASGGGIDFSNSLEVSTDGGVTWNSASSATIAAGQTEVRVRASIIDDALDEVAETFTLSATVTSGATANSSVTGTATIADDDASPSLSINDVTVNEGAGTISFTVTLSAASGRAITVDYATAAGSAASDVDYGARSGTLTFSPGVTTQTFTVAVANDPIFEGSESFAILLSNAVNAAVADGSGTATILDDGTGSGAADNDRPTFGISNVTAAEGAASHAVFAITMSNAATTDTVFSLALFGGTATAGGVDFGPGIEVSTDGGITWSAAATATIAAGSTEVLVRTPLADDAVDEAAETFTLTATRTSGPAANAAATGIGTINDDDVPPTLSIGSVSVNEGAGTATFNVTLSAASEQVVSVDYSSFAGSAAAGLDFTNVSGTLHFSAGVISQSITVPIVDDSVFEQSEAFTVQLSSPTNATLATATATGTILDDGSGVGATDTDVPGLSVSNVVATEGASAYAVFSVALSNSAASPITVNLSLASGGAQAGVDFTAALEVSLDSGSTWLPATSVTFAPGTTAALVRSAITDDLVDEDAEGFSLEASVVSGTTTNATAAGVGTIFDNDSAPSLAVNDVTVNEAAGTLTFTVSLSTASGQAVTVDYTTANGTALAGGDFTAGTGSLTFAPGVTAQTVVVSIADDSVFEGSEGFSVLLSNPLNAGLADDTGVGTILDDGTGPGGSDNDRPTLTVSGGLFTEGADTFALFGVALSNASTTAVSVALSLSPGSAAAGADYASSLEVSSDGGVSWSPATSATFLPGETSVLVRAALLDDLLDEAAEDFTLTATRTSGPTVNAAAFATASLIDDDALPALSVNDVTVNEAAGTLTFTVSLSTASGQAVTVDYTTANGTALAGGDFTAGTGSLTFAPGVTAQTVVVSIADDSVFEGSEEFSVLLSNPLNAGLADDTGVGTILDDGTGPGGSDNDRPTLTVSGGLFTEGADTFALFSVALSNASTTAVSVALSLSPGSAAAGADYASSLEVSSDGGVSWSPATSATFLPGETSVLVRAAILDDLLDEAAEDFTLTATRTSGPTVNAAAFATASLIDDDALPALSVNDVTVNEAAGTLTFTVSLSTASGQAVTVDYTTANGTALAGGDFTAGTGSLTFAPGVTAQTVVVSIADDSVFEGSEGFSVLLSNPLNAGLADDTGVGTILDDGTGPGGSDNDRPTLTVSGGLFTEGADTFALFSVALSNASTTAVSVALSLSPGSAAAGADYASSLEVSSDGGVSWSPATSATFLPGETSVLVRAAILDDLLDEAAEDFTLTATRTSGPTVNAAAFATASLIDDDALPALSVNDVTVNEAAGTLTFTVSLSTASGQAVTVDYTTANGTALAGGDFTAGTGSLTFAPGVTAQTVVVSIADDSVFEGSEEFSVLLSNPLNAGLADDTGVGTILDDGTGPGGSDNDRPTLTVSGGLFTEGADTFALFSVALSNASTTAVSVALSLSPGSAAAGADYASSLEVSSDGGVSWSPATSATFLPGETSVLVRAALLNDVTAEPNEDFTLGAIVSTGSTGNTGASGAATITDDDAPPTIRIDDVVVDEGAGTLTFNVELSRSSGLPISLSFATAPGVAGSSDFTSTSGVLNFAPGTTSQTITVNLRDDALFENTESFTVVLSGATNAVISDGIGSATILDDDVRRGNLTLITTSDAGTPAAALAPGEIATYELRLELAEGSNALLTAQGILPAGLRFLPDTPIVVGYEGISSSVSGFAAGAYTNATADAVISAALSADDDVFTDGDAVFFKLGTLTNNDADADREFVTIRFQAVATNAALNRLGKTLDATLGALVDRDASGTPGYVSLDRDGDNLASGSEVANDPLNDGSGVAGIADIVTTTIAEPILVVDKQITSAPATIIGGSEVVYTLTISHAAGSNGTAWEATLADTLPLGLLFTQVESVTLAGGAQQQSAPVIGALGLNLGGSWDIPVGGSVTVVYRARVTSAAVLGGLLDSVADVTWSSTDGVSADERTGADGLPGSGNLNDYRRRSARSVTIDSGAATFELEKEVVGDAEAEIGERLTYRLTLKVADGTLQALSLNDLVPAGFALVSGSATLTPGAGVTVTGAIFSYSPNILTLDVAQLESAVDGAENTVTITYAVDVLDVPANDAGGGPGRATKVNTATATYNPGTGALIAQDTATVRIVEPVIAADERVVSAPAQPNAGDTITFQIVISHAANSTGNAYNVVFTDVLPTDLGAITVTAVSGTAATPPAIGDFTVLGNTILTVTPFDLALGETVTITYTAVVQDTVQPGAILLNQALVTAQSIEISPSGNVRDRNSAANAGNYDATGAAVLITDSTFSVTKQASAATAQIGDRVRYTLVVDVIEGTTPGFTLDDVLPAGFALDPASIQVLLGAPGMTSSNGVPANVTNGNLEVNFGTLTNPGDNDPTNDQVTIVYEAVVSNSSANVNGAVKANSVTGNYVGLATPATAAASITIVEPVLRVQAAVSDSTPRLGQTVTYTLTISHDATSRATAHDLILASLLPPGLSLNAASIQFASTPGGTAMVSNTSTDGGPLQLTFNELAPGEVATIVFTATVSSDPAVIGGGFGGSDDELTSVISLSYDSQAGFDPEERTQAASLNDSLTVVGADLAVTLDNGVTTANAGQRLTYTITVRNNGTDTADNVVVSNTLPPIGGTFNPAASSPGATFTNGTVRFSLPTLAAGATTTFTVVLDLTATTEAGLESITSVVDVTHDDVEPSSPDNGASDTDQLVSLPDYRITVTDNRTSVKPGEVATYTITVANVGNQDGSGVIVSDLFTTGIYSAVTADGGGVIDLAAGTVQWNVGALAAGASVTLTLRGTVNATFPSIPLPVGTIPGAIPDNDAISHQVEVVDDGLGGADPNPGDNLDTDLDDLQPVPELRITQQDTVSKVKAGQLVSYFITATNAGTQDASGVVVRDFLPRGVTLVSARSADPAITGTPQVRPGVIVWDFDAVLPAGSSVVLVVTVRVDRDVEAEAELVNRVTITDDNTYGPDALSLRDNVAIDTNVTPAAPPPPVAPPRATPPAPRVQVFAFDRFNNFSTEERRPESTPPPLAGQLSVSSPVETASAALLPLMPIYSGGADPGATLVIALYNARGEEIGRQTVVADAGGNWLATFSSANARDLPNSVQITQLASPLTAGEPWGHNLRTNYSPALNPGQFFFHTPLGSTLGDEEAPLLGGLGLENPLQLGAVKYAGEMLGASASASGY